LKPVGFWVTFDTSEDSDVSLVGDDKTSLGTITIPSGAVSSSSGSSAILQVAPVADSELREMGSPEDIVCSAAFKLDSSTIQSFHQEITVTLGIQLPDNKKVEDSCLAKYTSAGWTCVSDLQIVANEPLTVQAPLEKESTATYAVVSSPKQKDDSNKDKAIVKYGIIAGCGFAGLIIVGGLIAMIARYKLKAIKSRQQRSQIQLTLESGVYKNSVELPS
jgi:hypothetical protein